MFAVIVGGILIVTHYLIYDMAKYMENEGVTNSTFYIACKYYANQIDSTRLLKIDIVSIARGALKSIL
jgi:hypothetical protein